LEALYRFDRLPTLRTGIKFGAVTSYDRTEGNDDGFSGTYSFVRKEDGNLVLADLKGPGCITRFHTPTPSGDLLEFYIDGSSTPTLSMPYRDYFTGEHAPFVRPVVEWAAGGAYSYLPIPYQKSCKVLLRAALTQFYDLNFVQYPEGTVVPKFDPKAPGLPTLANISSVWAQTARKGPLLVMNGVTEKVAFDKILAPGKAVTLLDRKKGGRITAMSLTPAFVFRGRARDTLIRITWDGEKQPAVLMPVGDFFGYAFGKPSMRSALLGSDNGTNYCFLPMPFASAAKVELVSTQTSGAGIPVQGTIMVDPRPLRADEGRFYARWSRENLTVDGRPFTWLKAQGQGHIVGLSIQAQGKESGIPTFFEGDDITVADGEMVVHGTGSEDFFNGGWYALPGRWDRTRPLPLSGCLVYDESTGRTGGYRFFINDAYGYEKSIVQTIEHGGEKNSVPADYTGVVYLYSAKPLDAPQQELGAKTRAVVDPDRLVFSIHQNNHLDTFGVQGMHITRNTVKVGDGTYDVLTALPENPGSFLVSHIGFTTPFASGGTYKVYGDFVKGPDCGMVRLSDGAHPLGPDIDLLASNPTLADHVYLGEVTVQEGDNALFLHIFGKNQLAMKAAVRIRFLVCEKVKGN